MKVLFVTVRMKPEYRDRILKGALEDGRGSRKDEPGCLRFDVVQRLEDHHAAILRTEGIGPVPERPMSWRTFLTAH